MRTNHYQIGNPEDIPKDILRKMIFALDNANLPMLTWRLTGGSILQVQKTEFMNIVRYWGIAFAFSGCYVMEYRDEYGEPIIRIMDEKFKIRKEFSADLVPNDHLLFDINFQVDGSQPFEIVVGDLIYLTNKARFYDTKTGELTDFNSDAHLLGGDYALGDSSALYLVRQNDITKVGISVVEGEYVYTESTYEKEVYGGQGDFVEEGIIFNLGGSIEKTTGPGIAIHLHVYDLKILNNAGVNTITHEGSYELTYPPGSDYLETFDFYASPTIQVQFENRVVGDGLVWDQFVTGTLRLPFGDFEINAFYDGSELIATGTYWHCLRIDGDTDLNGESLYVVEKLTYNGDPEDDLTKSYYLYDYYGNLIHESSNPITGILIEFNADWKAAPQTFFYVNSGGDWFVYWDGEVITESQFYNIFKLDFDVNSIEYLLYLPGIENNSLIKEL